VLAAGARELMNLPVSSDSNGNDSKGDEDRDGEAMRFAVDRLHLPDASLRALAPPLATFLPGAAITLAVAELSTRQMVSGSSRLVAGVMQPAQLAFEILIAAQVTGIADTNLVATHVDRRGAATPVGSASCVRRPTRAQSAAEPMGACTDDLTH
jgi:hypothetical protein